jgi:rare lipoprotein A (peptidoglycan hydrolase)
VLGIFMILVAATTSHAASGSATGGASSPEPVPVSEPAPLSQQLGRVQLASGSTGDAVKTLQLILNAKDFGPVDESGVFDQGTSEAVQRFQSSKGLAVDGVVGPKTRPALLGLMTVRIATWYGPGFYGSRTACGQRLDRSTLGVAHKTLPCGTKVTFYHAGRFLTVPVIDRGPYANGASWDLTAATARRIGMLSTARVRAIH